MKIIDQQYQVAKERYAEIGVDTDKAIAKLKTISISMHCWQGDDVGGFENMRIGPRRRLSRNRQLSRQSPQSR